MSDMVRKTPKQQSSPQKMKSSERQNQHCFWPVAVQTPSTVVSWFMSHDYCRFYHQKSILPVGTTRGWTEQLDPNKYQKVDMRHWLLGWSVMHVQRSVKSVRRKAKRTYVESNVERVWECECIFELHRTWGCGCSSRQSHALFESLGAAALVLIVLDTVWSSNQEFREGVIEQSIV